MRVRQLCVVFFIGVCVSIITAAANETTNPLIGKWLEKLPNGSGMLCEFTPATFGFMPVDASGNPVRTPRTPEQISYKSLGHDSKEGEGYSVEFKSADGKPGGGIMVYLKDSNTLTMIFPGMPGVHKMSRVNP